jgi:hypothetical protein
MGRALAACALSACITAVQAQGTSAPPPPSIHSPGQTPVTAQPPKRDNIAPLVDIRIQGEGIRLPTGVGEPPDEKPAEKTPPKPAAK